MTAMTMTSRPEIAAMIVHDRVPPAQPAFAFGGVRRRGAAGLLSGGPRRFGGAKLRGEAPPLKSYVYV
jgi:hypothetical protein